ncbi:MAG: gdhB, partial [Acidimicrobiia bacterium]|nr:gdhB [Acidimicrobiia bacterium]
LGRFPTLLNRYAREAMEARAGALVAAGVPQSLATVAALWPLAHGALDLVDIANRCGTSLPQVAATYYQLDDLLSLGWLRQELAALPTVDRWQRQSQASLLENVSQAQRRLTERALKEPLAATDPRLVRYQALIADVRLTGTNLAALTSCVGALADLG